MASEPFEPHVSPEIWQRFPDYRALSVIVRGFRSPPEATAPLPHLPAWCDAAIESWHQAFRQFGSNPKRTAPSFDSLIRRFRKDGALPKISPVVDFYNSLSIQYAAPFGGEDIDRYTGSPRLVVANGSEKFDTVQSGVVVIENPESGEIIWLDDTGVTCRRWNWRQCKRTGITDQSRNLWFVIDRLPPMPLEELQRAGAALTAGLQAMSPASEASITLLQP